MDSRVSTDLTILARCGPYDKMGSIREARFSGRIRPWWINFTVLVTFDGMQRIERGSVQTVIRLVVDAHLGFRSPTSPAGHSDLRHAD